MTAKKPAAKTTKTSAKGAKTPAAKYSSEVLRLTKHLLTITTVSIGDLFTAKDAKPLSEKGVKIQEYIAKNMGSYREQATELMSLLLGEKLGVIASQVNLSLVKKGCLVVPTTPCDHNYPVGAVAMVTDNRSWRSLMKKSEDFGNNLSPEIKDFRMPTEAEALEFVNANYEAIVTFLGVVVI